MKNKIMKDKNTFRVSGIILVAVHNLTPSVLSSPYPLQRGTGASRQFIIDYVDTSHS